MRSFKLALAAMVLPLASFADEAAAAAPAAGGGNSSLIALAVGFGIALAVMAGTTAQGRIAAAFMDGTSRNPGAADVMKTPLILGLAFVESLVLFAVLIVFLLLGKF